MTSTESKITTHPLVHAAQQAVKSATNAFSKAQLMFASQMKDDEKKRTIALIAKRKIEVAKAYVQLNMAYDKTSKTKTCVVCEGKFAEMDIAAHLQIGDFCAPCLAVYDQELSAEIRENVAAMKAA